MQNYLISIIINNTEFELGTSNKSNMGTAELAYAIGETIRQHIVRWRVYEKFRWFLNFVTCISLELDLADSIGYSISFPL
jgi:hypothetical protein